jgi:hypothetical protein
MPEGKEQTQQGGKMMKEEDICGEEMEIFFDNKIKKLNLELVKVTDKYNNFHFEIHLMDWSGENSRKVLGLHIKEVSRLKSIMDNLLIDMQEDIILTVMDKLEEKQQPNKEASDKTCKSVQEM